MEIEKVRVSEVEKEAAFVNGGDLFVNDGEFEAKNLTERFFFSFFALDYFDS